jgi:hypothetical protein
MMDYYSFVSSCVLLAEANLSNIQLKRTEGNNQDPIIKAIFNIGKSAIFGVVLAAALQTVSKQISNFRIITISTGITASISAMTCISRQTGHFTEEAENLDNHIGTFLDLAIRVSSIVTLVLLAPNANQSPVNFAFAATSVGFNILYDIYR